MVENGGVVIFQPDLETMDLDVAAMERGYGRPPLKQFAAPR